MKTLKSYASHFVSYFLDNIDLSRTNKIILFGSVARGDAGKNSDVDIFIDLKKTSKKQEKEIRKTLEEFYKSREALLFKSKGIDNKINIIIGKLDDWKSLKESIESTGIILYGNYTPTNVKGRKHMIISWDNIGKNRGAFLNKLYGVKIGDKQYKGLLEKFGGKRLGKSSTLIPIEHREDVLKEIRKYEVNARVIEVYV
jgi:predicted nucleotidyltransferase